MVKTAASKRYVKMLPEVTWRRPTALKTPGGLCSGWLTPALSQLPSASLWESFLPRAAFPPPPGGRCLSYHLSVTVVSPPELPQNKVVGFDALAGREQKRIISALEAGCLNSGCQQGPTPSSPSGIRSPLAAPGGLLLFLGLWGPVSNPLASRGGLCLLCSHRPSTACVFITMYMKHN